MSKDIHGRNSIVCCYQLKSRNPKEARKKKAERQERKGRRRDGTEKRGKEEGKEGEKVWGTNVYSSRRLDTSVGEQADTDRS